MQMSSPPGSQTSSTPHLDVWRATAIITSLTNGFGGSWKLSIYLLSAQSTHATGGTHFTALSQSLEDPQSNPLLGCE